MPPVSPPSSIQSKQAMCYPGSQSTECPDLTVLPNTAYRLICPTASKHKSSHTIEKSEKRGGPAHRQSHPSTGTISRLGLSHFNDYLHQNDMVPQCVSYVCFKSWLTLYAGAVAEWFYPTQMCQEPAGLLTALLKFTETKQPQAGKTASL